MNQSWVVNITKRLLLLMPMVLALVLGIFLYQALHEKADSGVSSLLGSRLPTFVAESLRTPVKTVTHADILGQPAVLNVWATWCPTCKAEHAFLNTMAANGVRIIGINYHDQRVQAQQWLHDYGDPYAFSIYDPQGQLGLGNKSSELKARVRELLLSDNPVYGGAPELIKRKVAEM